MNPDRAHDLWIRFLEERSLPPAEEQELSRALRTDAGLRRELLQDIEMDGFLGGVGAGPEQESEFSKSFFERLLAEGDATRFINKVESQLERKRPRTTRRLRLPASGAWTPAFIAAGLFLAALVVLLLFSSGPDPDIAQKKVSPKPAAEPKRPEAEVRVREEEKPKAPEVNERRPKASDALKADRERIERELQEAAERNRKTPEKRGPATPPQPQPEPPKREDPMPTPDPRPATRAVVVKVADVQNEVFLLEGDKRTPLRPGQDVLIGQGLETGPKSTASLRYADNTRIDAGPETRIDEFALSAGKRVLVARGSIRAIVAKQPKDQPMVLASPHGEAKVLGTTLGIHVDPDPKKGMRLEVDEGKVELKNLAGKTVLVESGHYAVAAAGETLVARPFERVSDCPAIRDTVLSKQDPNSNYGSDPRVIMEGTGAPGLLKFDLSSIPPGSVVQSVDLVVQVVNGTSNPYPLFDLKRDWAEGEATWNQAKAGFRWQTAGAMGIADRGTATLGTLGPAPQGAATVALNSVGIGVVQGWVNKPATNFGLIVHGATSTDSLQLESREGASKPKLVVRYISSAGKR